MRVIIASRHVHSSIQRLEVTYELIIVKKIPEKNEAYFLFVLRFYGPVNPMGSCRARSVYLTTRLLGRLSPLSG